MSKNIEEDIEDIGFVEFVEFVEEDDIVEPVEELEAVESNKINIVEEAIIGIKPKKPKSIKQTKINIKKSIFKNELLLKSYVESLNYYSAMLVNSKKKNFIFDITHYSSIVNSYSNKIKRIEEELKILNIKLNNIKDKNEL